MDTLILIHIINSVKILCVILTIGLIGGFGFYLGCQEEDAKKSTIKSFIISILISLFLAVFIPSRKDCYWILGLGGAIDYIENNQTLQDIPAKYIEYLDLYIDDKLEKFEENE